ncbi:hypothetical protein [Leptospira meyeri]|uniref:hypothetical protein n=1 Tax=Leptospira meyeri TaxID=29508 RepID=UPI000C2B4E2A|nr:hypothetical protein [Leptospira meyeri]PJZ79218.1 hypothetical protein CH359_19205 [Leptospira meyeri]
MNQEEVIIQYNKIKTELGHQPSQKEFTANSSITSKQLQKLFGGNAFTKLVELAGDNPKQFLQESKTDDELIIILATWIRKLGYFPKGSDWLYYQISPTEKTYNKRFGRTTELPNVILKFLENRNDWEDVIQIIGRINLKPKQELPEYIEYNKNYIEINNFPLLSQLETFSREEGKSIEFEKMVPHILRLFGFVIKPLGQGTGRNPDGIGYSTKFHIGFLYDAKARKDRYNFGTDDRIFNEYISSFRKFFSEKGLTNTFFLIISSEFSKVSRESLSRVEIPIYLITTEQLRELAIARLNFSAFFEPEDFHHFLAKINGIGAIDISKLKLFIRDIEEKYYKD